MRPPRNRWIALSAGILVLFVLLVARKRIYELYILEHFDTLAPSIELQTLDGATLTPDAFSNKVVLLDFWATWCGPCRRTLPLLQDVYAEYRGNPDVMIVAVNTSWNNTIEDAREFVARNHYEMPFAYDTESRIANVLVRPRGIPTFCLLDRSGRFRIRHVGYFESMEDYRATLKRQIDRLLMEHD